MNIAYHLTEIDDVVKKIFIAYPDQKCYALYAEMGSGKTTLINSFCRYLGVQENTSSPTFSIINEYRTKEGLSIYHTDWYRLKGVQDALEAGIGDILENGKSYCFIEWPEIAEPLLPKDCVKISLKVIGDTERQLSIL